MRFLAAFVIVILAAPVHADEGDAAACLKEINARRAEQRLPPYAFDQKLADGALLCAKWRAERLCAGHCSVYMDDWAIAPKMLGYAAAGGCAAWPPKWGFGACAMYERDCHYCGAVRVLGRDGRMYCHLFVR